MSENNKDSLQSSDPGHQETNEKPQEASEALETSSSLRDTPPLQSESLDAPKLEASATLKTQGVRVSRGTCGDVLRPAAERAARSGRRNDVHEYMRLRRSYV